MNIVNKNKKVTLLGYHSNKFDFWEKTNSFNFVVIFDLLDLSKKKNLIWKYSGCEYIWSTWFAKEKKEGIIEFVNALAQTDYFPLVSLSK